MIGTVLSLILSFSAQAQESQSITMVCKCTIYDSTGLQEVSNNLNSAKSDPISELASPTMAGRVAGIQFNASQDDIDSCANAEANDLAGACPNAFAKTLASCQQEAKAWNPEALPGTENFSVNPETCFVAFGN